MNGPISVSDKVCRLSRRTLVGALAAAAFGMTSGQTGTAVAADWPTKPVTIVVAYPAGGGTDIAVRAMMDVMSAKLGQPILVQNVAGAGGGVAATKVAKEKPDGYTLLATNSTSITLAPLVQKAAYDVNSFTHVAMIGEFQNAFFTMAKAPYSTLDELIAFAKKENRPIKAASQLALDRLVMQYIAKERGSRRRKWIGAGGAVRRSRSRFFGWLMGSDGERRRCEGGVRSFVRAAEAGAESRRNEGPRIPVRDDGAHLGARAGRHTRGCRRQARGSSRRCRQQ
jgi:hypothetical protein